MNEEIKKLTQVAVAEKTEQFKKAMTSNNVTRECQASIILQVNSFQDHMADTFDLFRTPFLIEKYMEKNFHLVLPSRVILGSGDFQYVSVVKLLKKIVDDKSFQEVRRSKKRNEGILEDLEDGLHFKNHAFFKNNPEALR